MVDGNKPILQQNSSDEESWTNLLNGLTGIAASDMTSLKHSITNNLSFDSIIDHHQKISRGRGTTPWKHGELDHKYREFTPPDFTLTAASRLFLEGVNPQ